MVEHKVNYVAVNLLDEGLFGIGICNGEAVNAPGMSAGPAGLIGEALKGYAVHGRARYWVELIMVVGRAVATDKEIRCGFNVVKSGLLILGVACYLGSPEEEGRVHKRVHHCAISARTAVSPALMAADDEFAFL